MARYSKVVAGAAMAVVAATVLAACGSGASGGDNSTASSSNSAASDGGTKGVDAAFNAATTGIVNKSDKTGGTINLQASGDCDSWDPANTYYGWCFNMQRLFTRTLIGYASLAGENNVKLEPDLAQGMGEHSADFKTWTYKLKSGVKWEDGSPVTSKDVAYGISRLFATDVLNGGPSSYFINTIDAPSGYAGVYKSGVLPTIETPDDSTVTFKLKVPYADFDYLMALPASAPVPNGVEGGLIGNAADKGDKYTLHPVSNGPFKIESYTQNQEIKFVRNDQWSQDTDTIRTPKADEIDLTINSDPDDIDRRLQAGEIDSIADGGVQSTFQSQIVTNEDLKKNTDNPVTGYTRYIVIMQTVAPLTNVHCRRAIAYALNKADLQRARGGSYGGDIAHTMSVPTLPGYDASSDLYPSGSDNTGDLTKAKDELQQCGQPNGFTVKEAYVNQGRGTDVYNATQQALARVGIKVQPAASDQSTYYSKFIGSPSNITTQGLGIAQAGWGADFPTGYGFWNSIANGANILPEGNSNYPSLNDPVVNNILDESTKTSGDHADEFKKLDAQVMQDAVYIPYVFDKSLFWRSSRLTNVRVNFAVGSYYDWVNMGVSS